MIRDIFINSACHLVPGMDEPDVRHLVSPIEARRMGRLMKRCLWTSSEALKEASIEKPDAIITGTCLGSVEDTELLLKALTGVVDAPMKPTNFMQSTHNTMSSLIGIRTGSHGYNATYSQGLCSFESAMLDALVQLDLGDIDNALVTLADESTPLFSMMLAKLGEQLPEIVSSMVLSRNPEGALCAVRDFRMTRGRAAYDASMALASSLSIPAECILDAPAGYCDGAHLIASGQCGRVLVVNPGQDFDNTAYTLLEKI